MIDDHKDILFIMKMEQKDVKIKKIKIIIYIIHQTFSSAIYFNSSTPIGRPSKYNALRPSLTVGL